MLLNLIARGLTALAFGYFLGNVGALGASSYLCIAMFALYGVLCQVTFVQRDVVKPWPQKQK